MQNAIRWREEFCKVYSAGGKPCLAPKHGPPAGLRVISATLKQNDLDTT